MISFDFSIPSPKNRPNINANKNTFTHIHTLIIYTLLFRAMINKQIQSKPIWNSNLYQLYLNQLMKQFYDSFSWWFWMPYFLISLDIYFFPWLNCVKGLFLTNRIMNDEWWTRKQIVTTKWKLDFKFSISFRWLCHFIWYDCFMYFEFVSFLFCCLLLLCNWATHVYSV